MIFVSDFVLANGIVIFAALMQACTGFGFSVLATPFLLLIYPAREAIQINIILSIVISAALLPRIAQDVDNSLLKRLVIGSLLGGIIGVLIYAYANPDLLRLIIGALLLLVTALILVKFKLRRTGSRDAVVGVLSGMLTSGLGMPGPPLLLYFAGSAMQARTLRSTTLAYFLFIYALSLVLQVAVASSSTEIWLRTLGLLPATAIGIFAGNALFHKVSQAIVMRMAYATLIVTGSYLVISTLTRV